MEFREGYDPKNRIVKQSYIEYEGIEYFISTVDLGIDHGGLYRTGVYWETMIFHPISGLVAQDRYTSRELAVTGHADMIKMLLKGKFD